MSEHNEHKYLISKTQPSANQDWHLKRNQGQALNYSRTLGHSRNWIGCGYLNKAGIETDHIDIRFPFYSLVYVVVGEGCYIDEKGKTWQLKAGSCFQRRPGVKHTTLINPNSGWKEYYLDCNKALYDHHCAMMLINSSVPVYKGEPSIELTTEIEALMKLLQGGTEEEVAKAYLSYLNILHLLFSRQSEGFTPDTMVSRSLKDFEQLYATRFDLKTYCRDNGWGYETFRKTFKKQLGVSPRDYLIRKRMDEACRLLRATDRMISDISDALGYASPYEFSNQFTRHFNLAPSHYRDGV